MDWTKIRKQLEQILQRPVTLRRMSVHEWTDRAGTAAKPGMPARYESGGETVLLLEAEGDQALAMAFEHSGLSDTERRLAEMAVTAYRSQEKAKPGTPATEDERKALLIRDWFIHQQELGNTAAELPELLATQFSLYKAKVPLLLYGEFSDVRSVSYRELKKLLDSFFGTEIHLIPLMEKEWLILAPESLLSESNAWEREDGEEESLEETLAALAEGLYEMLSNEWVGECHLAVHYPMTPAKALMATVVQLREIILLGKAFYVGSNLHLPWRLHLEKLVYDIPDAEKARFVSLVFNRKDAVLDGETISTLESFFSQDCNVSETAKKLYIHRNTLLYRLDKFKHETGLDVRTFNDAVMVKIALLLYKVTKRQ